MLRPARTAASPLRPGWLEVSHTHFPDTDTAGWVTVPADAPTTVCNSFGAFLGGFGEFGRLAHATRTYTGLYPHEAVRLRFTFLRLDSWTNEWARAYVDGQLLWERRMSEGDDDGEHVCGDDGRDAIITVDELVQHSSPNLTLHITSTLNEAPDDESWGIQDVSLALFYTGGFPPWPAPPLPTMPPPLVIESQLPPSPRTCHDLVTMSRRMFRIQQRFCASPASGGEGGIIAGGRTSACSLLASRLVRAKRRHKRPRMRTSSTTAASAATAASR